MGDLYRIMVLDDDGDFRNLVTTFLGSEFHNTDIISYDPVSQGIPSADYDWSSCDVLLLDYNLHGTGKTGIDIVVANKDNRLFPATIILTGAGGEEVAVRALRAGVYDYLRKQGLKKEQLKSAVINAIARHNAFSERLYSLDEARQLASKEAELIIAAYRAKYDEVRSREEERFRSERLKFENQLQEYKKKLQDIEDEKRRAEESKRLLEQDQARLKEKLEVRNDGHDEETQQSIQDELQEAVNRLKETEKGLAEAMEEHNRIKSAMEKAQWQKEQEEESQKQFQDDLHAFDEEVKIQQEHYARIAARLDEEARKKEEAEKTREAQARKDDQSLFDDVTSQLGLEGE